MLNQLTNQTTKQPIAMNPKIIRSPEDHESAIARLDVLMDLDPEAGSDEANELELLSFLIEAYEKEKFPISLPSPVDAIKFVMDQRGLSRKDLRPFIGSESKIFEFFQGTLAEAKNHQEELLHSAKGSATIYDQHVISGMRPARVGLLTNLMEVMRLRSQGLVEG